MAQPSRIRQLSPDQGGERKAFLAAVINAIPTPVLVKDREHTYVAVNNAFTKFFGRDADEVIGRNDFDFFTPEDASFYQGTDREALERDHIIEYEHLYTINGVSRWMFVRKSPLVVPDGECFVVLVLIDVTERLEAEQASRRSEARFRRLTNLSADWYWEQDDQLRFTFLSDEVTAKSGHLGNLSKGLTRWEHPGIDFDSARWEAHRATCEAHAPFRDFVYRRTGRDGVDRWLSVSGEPVFDDSGKFVGYQGVGRDVTREKQAKRELRRSKDLYAALSQTNRAIIHIRDPQALYAEVCRVAVAFGHFRLAWIGFVDEDTGWVQCAGMDGPASANYPPLRVSIDPSIPEGGGYASAVLRENRAYVVNDYFADPRIAPWAETARASGVKSMMALPLRKGERVIGVLSLYGGEVGFFSDELVSLLNEMADNLSFAITNLELSAEREATQRALEESERRFRQLAANIPQVFWIADASHRQILYVSPAYERVWGRPIADLHKRADDWLRAVHPDDRDRIAHASAEAKPAGFDEEYRILHSDGQVRWIHDRAFPILNEHGEVALLTGIAEDITARKEAEDQLLFLAHHDPLTSLPNRALYQDRLQQAVVQARRARYNVAVVFLDLDHFKLINDTLGHAAGDRLLHQVGLRLKGALRAVDTVGRLGGDEFALVLSELCGPADAEAAVQKLLLRLQEPFDMEGHEVFVTASAGISLYPSDSEQPDALVKYADTAMYRAKELGRTNFQFYNAEMNAKAVERMTLEGQLRRALEREEFALHYQPKVCFRTGAVTGVEALLRWNHPELGMVNPARFISILEDNGLIVPVGEWVLSEVCTQINAWQECGMPISVALNLSGRQLQHKDLERSFNRILLETEVDPHRIELEITESVLMRDAQHAGQVLARLKDLGMRLAIDDFGTGYSSLNYLKRFPLDALKIDRTFVQDLITDADDVAIVEAIVALARTLRLTTIAEGIEGMSQFALLRALGCDEYQGYHFSRPVPADQIPPLISGRVTSPPASDSFRHVHGDDTERVAN